MFSQNSSLLGDLNGECFVYDGIIQLSEFELKSIVSLFKSIFFFCFVLSTNDSSDEQHHT